MTKPLSFIVRLLWHLPLFIGRCILISFVFDILNRQYHWYAYTDTDKIKGILFVFFTTGTYLAIRLGIKPRFFKDNKFNLHFESDPE